MKDRIISSCIVGNTNAGKSTLINALVGKKISIVNKKRNTTQESIIGILNIKNTQIIIYDNPGLSIIKKNRSENEKTYKKCTSLVDKLKNNGSFYGKIQ